MPGDSLLREEMRAGIDASMTQINSVRQQISTAVQGRRCYFSIACGPISRSLYVSFSGLQVPQL